MASVSPGKIILLSFGNFFNIQQLSSDFQVMVLYVSKAYIDDMFSTEMIYKRVKYGVKMHKTPLLQLSAAETSLLHQRLDFIREVVSFDQHRYYKEMILSGLLIFFLDLSHIIEKEGQEAGMARQSRDEIYFQRFLDLLVLHYKAQHHVAYYADKLHITTHYLTLIVKRVSGQTVSDLLFQLLFSEAKLLLQQPDLSIQQIAGELHFSDQSAFGKFFKRKSGISPKAFGHRILPVSPG
jgi:AraC family transcriptional activator of pobA